MIKLLKTVPAASVFALAAAISPAFAADATPLRVNVPFSFVFAGKNLPAGSYIVETSAAGVVTIQGVKLGLMALSGPSGSYVSSSKPSLVFEKESDGEHLIGVNRDGASRAISLRFASRGKIAALVSVAAK